MKIAAHIEKWQRFDALRAKFSPLEEFELWYWTTLSGGTAIINAGLHAAGLTDENSLFATQMPDVYAVHDAPGVWHHVLAERCDLIHVGLPEVQGPLPGDLQEAFAAMEVIETFRDSCVRSDRAITADVIASCEKSYMVIVASLGDRLARWRA